MSNAGSESETLSIEAANQLVIDSQEWAEGIARAVARAWNLDWKLDGLDGAALEALLFCARRFQPNRGVPFRGYARKRIHEAACEAARKSRGWRKVTNQAKHEAKAREISNELLTVYPELRGGEMSFGDDDSSGDGDGRARGAIRQMLVSATIIATRTDGDEGSPEQVLDQRKMLVFMAALELVHQFLMWKVYWEGLSMRNVAVEWETDELNVIREHKAICGFLVKSFSKARGLQLPKVRPGLRNVSLKLNKEFDQGPFSKVSA